MVVIIDPDKQWKYVANYIAELMAEYVPKEHRHGFIFHGKDLFHETGRSAFDRKKFPLERSHEVLKKLIRIPRRFKLPLVWGFIPNVIEVERWHPDTDNRCTTRLLTCSV